MRDRDSEELRIAAATIMAMLVPTIRPNYYDDELKNLAEVSVRAAQALVKELGYL